MATMSMPPAPGQAPVSGPPPDPQSIGLGMPPTQGSEAQTPTAVKFQSFITAKWEDIRTAYTVFHQLCWQNALYYAGQLWILWDKDRRIWYPAVPEDEYTPQPCVNEFAPAIDSITSVFRIPEVEATPKTGSENDMDVHDVAEVANVLSHEFARANGLLDGGANDNKDGVGDRAGQMFTLFGNFFTFVRPLKDTSVGQRPDLQVIPMIQVMCPDCGLSAKVPPDDPGITPSPSMMLMGEQVSQPPCPQCGSTNVQMVPTQDVQQKQDPISGQPVTTPVIKWRAECCLGNPLYALPRPGATSFAKQGYLWWAERMTLDEIYEKWQYEAQPDNQYLDSMESSWEISMNYYFTGYSNLTLATKESALVLTVFIEPNKVKDIPEGGVATWCNEKIIHFERWEEACPVGHQLTHFGYLNMPTTYFYRSSSFDLAQIQKELNRYESIIALHSMTAASDSLVIDENTKVSNVTGRGDRIIYWRSIGPGAKEPHRLEHGSLDSGVYEQRQRLRDALQNVSGAVAVWRGQQTGSVTSAAGISQLRGQAEQMFSKPTANWNSGWVTTFQKGVKMLQKMMEPWEIAELMGPGHDVQIQKFKGADLDKMVEFVATTHGLPKTRDEKRQDMLEMYDRKMLDTTDPAVKQQIQLLFGETGMQSMFNRDATRARWENDRMAQGQPPTFMPDIEDLEVHMFVHAERMKRLDFEQLEDPIKQMFVEHYAETKMAYQQMTLMAKEADVEYKAASAGKVAPEQGEPGTLLGGGEAGGESSGEGGGGRVDGGPHAQPKPERVPAGQSVVKTGPPKGGK